MVSLVFIEDSSMKALHSEAVELDLLRKSHLRSRVRSCFDFAGSVFPAESRLEPITVESPLSYIANDGEGPFCACFAYCSDV